MCAISEKVENIKSSEEILGTEDLALLNLYGKFSPHNKVSILLRDARAWKRSDIIIIRKFVTLRILHASLNDFSRNQYSI
jgi:hypothetical protein